MSALDEKKSQIGIWKYWLSVVVATALVIGAYLVKNIRILEDWLILVGSFTIIGLFVAGVFITIRINKHIRDLRDL